MRELRSNLASFLERVAGGEVILVTERGRPVARLGPVDEGEHILDRLASEGRLRRARRPRRPLPPAIPAEGSPVTELLIGERGGRVWRPTSTPPPSSS